MEDGRLGGAAGMAPRLGPLAWEEAAQQQQQQQQQQTLSRVVGPGCSLGCRPPRARQAVCAHRMMGGARGREQRRGQLWGQHAGLERWSVCRGEKGCQRDARWTTDGSLRRLASVPLSPDPPTPRCAHLQANKKTQKAAKKAAAFPVRKFALKA